MNEPERPRLAVYLREQRIGELERRGPTRYSFSYDERLLDEWEEGAIVLSASLPVRAGAFPSGLTKPFFEGLLPEGLARREIARMTGVSEGNGFGLLEQIGSDCAGAVVIVPAAREQAVRPGRTRWLGTEELEATLLDLATHPLGVTPEEGIRLTLGGVQHKLIIAQAADGRIGQPVDGTPSTHIIKPGQDAYADIVTNEAFCLRVAARAGVETARVEIRRYGAVDALLVKRFDRARSDTGAVVRVHQEDLCQALGILPDAKYESEGGPSVASIAALLREIGTARDLQAFSRALLINFVLGNSDAHGKNYALLYSEPGRAALAPLYDIVATAVYPALTTRLSMSVVGIDDPAAVDLPAWMEMLRDAGFNPQAAQLRREVDSLLAAVEATRAIARAEGWHRPVVDQIVGVALTRAAQLTR